MTDQDRLSDDEALSGLLDHELTNEQEAVLRDRLAREPELAARYKALQQSDAALRGAYDPMLQAPLPARTLELLRSPVGMGATAVPLRRSRARLFSIPTAFPAAIPMAMAAGVALVVGAVLGLWLASLPPGHADWTAAGTVEPGTGLHRVLQSAPSAMPQDLGGGERAMVHLTFKSADGRYCRHADVSGAERTVEALACRSGDAWRLELLAFRSAAPPATADVYRPASGPDAALAGAIAERMMGEPLDAEAERALIAQNWQGLGQSRSR